MMVDDDAGGGSARDGPAVPVTIGQPCQKRCYNPPNDTISTYHNQAISKQLLASQAARNLHIFLLRNRACNAQTIADGRVHGGASEG